MLITLFIEAGLVCLILGSLAFGASHAASRQRLKGWLYDDPLTRSDNRVPNGARVASITTALGLAIIAFWWVRMSTPLKFEALFVKEGPLELLTFLALVVSAALCLLAARHTVRLNKAAVARVIAGCYAVLGAGLFVIGMEEISWGQTYLRWQTPESWTAINSQRETTVHNLLEQRTLHVIEQRIILAFVAFALIAIWLAIRQVHPFITALAPHFSTAPILLLVGYSAYRFHLEVPEILFAIFVSAYAWRVYRASVPHAPATFDLKTASSSTEGHR